MTRYIVTSVTKFSHFCDYVSCSLIWSLYLSGEAEAGGRIKAIGTEATGRYAKGKCGHDNSAFSGFDPRMPIAAADDSEIGSGISKVRIM